ncbi:HWE histidine kinase domain-containing protein [Erythrobacter sp. Alg231-14]|uniref:HWE histidine kinase domain-containing protein n=1 Tax=Erythrobacter sp. Alg231-14 TaxID=1922225 RepID=UPI000D5596CE
MNALIEYEKYMPHGMCLLWEPWLVILWSGSDLLIFAAYMAIPMAIWLVLKRRPDLGHRGLVSLFAAFILLCGITHALSIVTLWYAIYPFMGVVKLATAAVSLVTAVVLFRLIPTFIRIPTPQKHEEVIAQLEVTLADLAMARDQLERTVAHHALALEAANTMIAQNARNDVQRSRNLIQLLSMLTRPGVYLSDRPEVFMRELRGRVNALSIATSNVMEHGDGASCDIEHIIRRQVEPHFAHPDEKLSVKGDVVLVGMQGAQQISLVAWELAGRLAQMNRWDRADAKVAVEWRVEPSTPTDSGQNDRGPTCSIEWRETKQSNPEASHGLEDIQNDPIPVTPAPLDGFSEVLLTQIIPRLLHGKARIDIEQSTFIYRLTCPLSSLQNTPTADACPTSTMNDDVTPLPS